MPVSVGETFAGFTILRVLGAGGMGTVYLAAHPRLPRQDALKVLPPLWTADPEYRERFLREANLSASLSHPNILGVHDRGEYDGQLWISMDYVNGTDAAKLVREHHPDGLPAHQALEIVTAVASALDYAHGQGLLHRDIKPANILLDPKTQRIFLADFGIARLIDDPAGLTATNMAVGTMAYAAPEQLRGEPLDGRTDEYALACTAFDLLTGSPPYVDSNPAVVITKHVAAAIPSVSERRPELVALDPVLAKAMAKTPGDRYASCGEFARELSYALNPPSGYLHRPPPPPPSPSAPAATLVTRTRRPSRPKLFAALAVTAALLVVAAVFAGVKFMRPNDRSGSASPAAATHEFSGTYRADYAPGTDLEGNAVPGAPSTTGTWDVRSTCGSGGCIATASYTGTSGIPLVSNLVFDQIAGSWIAVGLGSTSCGGAPTELWVIYTLQPQPDGTLSGDSTRFNTNGCGAAKLAVTFTRTGDPDLSKVSDPATLPPRVTSVATTLRGRYHETVTMANGDVEPGRDDLTVRTVCLRTGERCMSMFHAPDGVVPLVFAGEKWTRDEEADVPCGLGGTTHIKFTAEYPVPDPPQDPIKLLTGHGQKILTGSACVGGDLEDKFERTGD
ncbi:serine/threonine-protein kinase [Mycobacterium paraterrae]|uniref:non-specific serine/threonine protein kinase n=1 Tax=Mycobacterium paraterrae TaxID=577492 RepID=A0ABY3VHU3_9MYCO|nr:serine/threonine-protein kinase [Mycobacterium paraterrae]UMB68994.1 serine/threonine protein kinase [Mycobacterium paraterrae]